MQSTIEAWQGRVYADSFDEAAMMIREASGCGQGKLVLKEIIPGWFEYMVHYERNDSPGGR